MKDEDPLKHLEKFDRICALQKINNVTEDALKLRLFPFSLSGHALAWESSIQPGTVTTWEQCKHAFLAKFFPHVKNCSAKENIASFTQHRDGLALVENVALSDGNYPEEYDRSDRGDSSVNDEKHKKEIKTLNDKLDKILTGQQKQVHFVCEDDVNQEGEDQQTEEVCYMSNQGGYYKGYNTNNNTNLSYRSTNVENPQDQVYPPQQNQNQGGQQTFTSSVVTPKGFWQSEPRLNSSPSREQLQSGLRYETMLQQLIKGQTSGATELNTKLAEINNKVDCSYNDLNKKLESLNSKVQHLEAKSHNIPSSSKG
ncbi:unnamed protein product, partial [Microthlaspi erraticum]